MTQAGSHPQTLIQSRGPVQGPLCGLWWTISCSELSPGVGGQRALSDQGLHFPSAAHCPLTQLEVSTGLPKW